MHPSTQVFTSLSRFEYHARPDRNFHWQLPNCPCKRLVIMAITGDDVVNSVSEEGNVGGSERKT